MGSQRSSKNTKMEAIEAVDAAKTDALTIKNGSSIKVEPTSDIATEDFDCPWLPNKAYFRVDEVARYFDYTEQTIKKWIEHGHFPGTLKVEGPYRIPRDGILHCKFRYMLKNPEAEEGI